VRAIAVLLLLTLPLSGCYGYVPYRPGLALQSPQRVRVHLSVPQDVRLTDVTANNVTLLDGEVVSAGADTLVVSTNFVTSASGMEQLGGGVTTRIPRSAIGSLEVRRFDKTRTAGLVGIIVALTGITAGLMTGSATGSGSGGGGSTQ
jgi:hypothetical protein